MSHRKSSRGRFARRAARYFAEPLEPRRLLANFHVVEAYMSDLDGNRLDTPAVGSNVYVRIDFTTISIAPNTNYQVRTVFDGVSATNTINWGSGLIGTGNWVYLSREWLITPGSHSFSVTVDYGNNVSETNEFDNTDSGSFTGAVFSPRFDKPLEGTEGVDWTIVNYVDLDVDAGLRDYRGGTWVYDGHNGWDIALPNFRAMDRGYNVYAAAAGTVSFVQDGNYDRNTDTNGQPSNVVYIDHGNGWQTRYHHLRRDSIAVHEGQVIPAGLYIGLIGSSGNSSDAHLHWQVMYNGTLVEPNVYPTGYLLPSWRPTYSAELPAVIDDGITNYPPNNYMKEGPGNSDIFPPSAASVVYFWNRVGGIAEDTPFLVRWYRPDGSVYTSSSGTFLQTQYGTYVPTLTLNSASPLGTWQVALFFNGTEYSRETFTVSNTLRPQFRAFLSNSYIIDGRTTPYRFGDHEQGLAPTARTITIQNTGEADLTFSNFDVPTGFKLLSPNSGTIAPGGEADVDIALDEKGTPGHKAGWVTLNTNDPDLSQQSIQFRVEGDILPINPVSTTGNDDWYVKKVGLDLHIWNNATGAGTPLYDVTFTNVSDLDFPTSGGDDRLYIDLSGGDPIPADGIAYVAGNGIDLLTVYGAAGNDTWTYTPSLTDTLTTQYGVITFNGVQNLSLQPGNGATNMTFGASELSPVIPSTLSSIDYLGGSGDDNLTFDDTGAYSGDATGYTITSTTFATPSFPDLTFSSVQSITLNASSGNNTIRIDSLLSTTTLTVNAGNGDDTFAFGSGSVAPIDGPVFLNGQSGADRLNYDDHNAIPLAISQTYTVGDGTIARSTSGLVTHTGLEALTLTTSASSDVVNVNATADTLPLTIAPATSGADEINVNLDNSGAASVLFDGTQRLGALNIFAGGAATLPANLNMLLTVTSLQLTAKARLDLTNNDLAIDYSGGSSPLATITAYAAGAYNFGRWNAFGLTSSTAANPPSKGITSLAIVDNAIPKYPTLAGQPVSQKSVLVKYTYHGDANLSGLVSADDVALMLTEQAAGRSGWQAGNFNFDTRISSDDYALLNQAIALQSAPPLEPLSDDLYSVDNPLPT